VITMFLKRSFENGDGRFINGAGAVKRDEPSGTSVGSSGSDDDNGGVGVVDLGGETAVVTHLSATSISRTAVGRRCARSRNAERIRRERRKWGKRRI
jgi:hypothetical protein